MPKMQKYMQKICWFEESKAKDDVWLATSVTVKNTNIILHKEAKIIKTKITNHVTYARP